MSTIAHVKGLAELQKNLLTLAPRMEANVMRAALAAGARIVRDAAKANVPVSEPSRKNEATYGGYAGALRDSLRYGAKVNLRKGKVIAYVRAGGKARNAKADTYYASWVEYGTAAHWNNKAKTWWHPGATPRPYLRPALDAEQRNALLVIGNFIKQRLDTKHGIDTKAIVIGDEEE